MMTLLIVDPAEMRVFQWRTRTLLEFRSGTETRA